MHILSDERCLRVEHRRFCIGERVKSSTLSSKEYKQAKFRNAQIVVVISNNANAGALMIAREHNIPADYINRQQFPSDDAEFTSGYWNQHWKIITRILSCLQDTSNSSTSRLFGNLRQRHSSTSIRLCCRHSAEEGCTVCARPRCGHSRKSTGSQRCIISSMKSTIEDRSCCNNQYRSISGDTPETLAAKVLQIEHQTLSRSNSIICGRKERRFRIIPQRCNHNESSNDTSGADQCIR